MVISLYIFLAYLFAAAGLYHKEFLNRLFLLPKRIITKRSLSALEEMEIIGQFNSKEERIEKSKNFIEISNKLITLSHSKVVVVQDLEKLMNQREYFVDVINSINKKV